MKKLIVFSVAVLLMSGGCSSGSKQTPGDTVDSANVDTIGTPVTDTIADAAEDPTEAQIAMIEEFYSHVNENFGNGFEDAIVLMNGTKNLQSQLKKAYEDEFGDGGGMAVWELTGNCCQDPGKFKLVKCENIAPNQFKVSVLDKGGCNKTSTITLTLVQEGEDWKIDSYKL